MILSKKKRIQNSEKKHSVLFRSVYRAKYYTGVYSDDQENIHYLLIIIY